MTNENMQLQLSRYSVREITKSQPMLTNEYSNYAYPGDKIQFSFQAYQYHTELPKLMNIDGEDTFYFETIKVQSTRAPTLRADTIQLVFVPLLNARLYSVSYDTFLMGLQKVGAILALFRITYFLRLFHESIFEKKLTKYQNS